MNNKSVRKWLLDTEDPLGNIKERAIKHMADANGRLTEKELHIVWDFATETPGHDINPKWLISMVEEIRCRRKTMQESVGTRLLQLDTGTQADLVTIVGCAINAHDAKEFEECFKTIAEMIFPELIGEIIFRKKGVQNG